MDGCETSDIQAKNVRAKLNRAHWEARKVTEAARTRSREQLP